jgi:hypothetical protein
VICAWMHVICAWMHVICAWMHVICAWMHVICAWMHVMQLAANNVKVLHKKKLPSGAEALYCACSTGLFSHVLSLVSFLPHLPLHLLHKFWPKTCAKIAWAASRRTQV